LRSLQQKSSRLTGEEKIKSDDYYQEGRKAIRVVRRIIAHASGGFASYKTVNTKLCCLVLFDHRDHNLHVSFIERSTRISYKVFALIKFYYREANIIIGRRNSLLSSLD
jgi:hypothetical protein